ncbi:hypothetical protein ASG89_29065 [Paenibacillus sp. Soil766]|uniref:hypothetical protein n=1 Tax=Paenibacillus sp. Soil766 TaxID=1736404 RepID=UPI00070A0CFD|nr:hypothetical protein [Paenibacillus sp. Soil766]KRE97956.1 hypothetical protein ASG89_29065 [Paenibacillus sp. Soil766]
MKLLMLDRQFKLLNTRNTLKEIEQLINECLADSGLYFSHLTADETVLYGEFEEYFENNCSQIQTVQVHLLTKEQLREEVLVDLNKYTERAEPEIEYLARQFDRNPIEETWRSLANLLDAIGWMDEVLGKLNEEPFTSLKVRLEGMMPVIQESVENQDISLIVDMLLYEILPFIKDITKAVQTVIDQEVRTYDLN